MLSQWIDFEIFVFYRLFRLYFIDKDFICLFANLFSLIELEGRFNVNKKLFQQ